MILTALPLAGVTAFAEGETHKSGNFEYVILEDGTAKITFYYGEDYGDEYVEDATLSIPAQLDGYTVTSIGSNVFFEDDSNYFDRGSIGTLIIPETVKNIDEGNVFGFLFGLKNIEVDNKNEYFSSQDGVLFNKDKTELLRYPCTISGDNYEYNIPDSVVSIRDYAFEGCKSLVSVTIPDSVTSIGSYAFYDCRSLESITIPESVTSIGDAAFADCGSLIDIYILNKNCNIVSSEYFNTIPTETTIHGYAGSAAESYAKENGNEFIIEEPQIVNGDVSGDGKLSTVDAKWILQYIAGSKDFSDEQFKTADLNGDGKLSIVDAKWVLQAVAGMRTV